ncbi:hypothetical protein BDV98DRAFT_574880 [Pterulicium gracile]|uniref:Uncharacterized protein n=1 Tax=Pterulicium gracile TaxID=1884261 RepID=A0A5C3Q5L8_9AGAR|nr:hypothetical protein BDV98DRAFT_574880 [Pterula gracilis]
MTKMLTCHSALDLWCALFPRRHLTILRSRILADEMVVSCVPFRLWSVWDPVHSSLHVLDCLPQRLAHHESHSLGHVSPGGHPTINDDQHRLVDLRLGIRRYPRLLQFDPTAPFQPLVGGLITMLFHGFYAWRMWTMSRNVILPILICMIITPCCSWCSSGRFHR